MVAANSGSKAFGANIVVVVVARRFTTLIVEVEAQVRGGVVGVCMRLVVVDGVLGVVVEAQVRGGLPPAPMLLDTDGSSCRLHGCGRAASCMEELFPLLRCGVEAVFSLGGDLE